MNDDQIVWEDPPSNTGTRDRFRSLLEQVKQRPGEWALIATYASPQSAYQARRNSLKVYPDFEFVAKSVAGVGRLYARYLNSGAS